MVENFRTEVFWGILIPFFGTSLGSACVLFMKNKINFLLQRALMGFAAGIMVAASIWSLIIPAMEQSGKMGKLAFIPAVMGFWFGIVFLLILDRIVRKESSQISLMSQGCFPIHGNRAEESKRCRKKTCMIVLAVTLHNLPEGMAVGAVYAGWLSGDSGISIMAALALSFGIAIQNFPEGAIISMPLRAEGISRKKSFFYGTLSGIVEPVGAVFTILAAGFVVPLLPYFLSFAAGAMVYVVVEELIPEMSEGKQSNVGTLMFTFGFTVMMALDVLFG